MGRLRQGIVRLIDGYAEGLLDKGEFEPRIARMRERLKQIEEQAQQIKDEASLERERTLILVLCQSSFNKWPLLEIGL